MAPDVDILNLVLEQADSDELSSSDIIDLGLEQKREFEEKKAFAEFQQAFPTPKVSIVDGVRREGFIPRFPTDVAAPTPVEPKDFGDIREFESLNIEAANAVRRGIRKTASDLLLGVPEIAARTYVNIVKGLVPSLGTEESRKQLPAIARGVLESVISAGATADQLNSLRVKIEEIAEREFPRSQALKNIDINELGLSVLDPRNPEARRLFVATTAETLPMMAGALTVAGGVRAAGASLTAAAVAGGATGGFQEAINSFDEAKRRGKTDAEALEVFALVFGTTTALDAFSIGFILSKLPKGLTRKIVSASAVGLVEGDTELVQETIQGLAVGDSIKEALQQGRVAFGPGVFLGASARAVISLGEQPDPSSRKSVSNILDIKPRDLPPEFTSKAKRQEFVDRLKDVAAKEETLLGDEENRALIEARLRSDEAVEDRNKARTDRINERAQQAFEEEVIEGLEDEPAPTPAPEAVPEAEPTPDVVPVERIVELTTKTNKELNQIARDLGLKGLGGLKKSVVIERILQVEGREGVVEEEVIEPRPSLTAAQIEKRAESNFLIAGDIVDGRIVRDEIPNIPSIDATFTEEPAILSGVREIPMDIFTVKGERLPTDKRSIALSKEIDSSGEISPLIIVDDGHPDGPYILEGGHRLDALKILGAKSFPALVVIDPDPFSPSRPEVKQAPEPKKPPSTNLSNLIAESPAIDPEITEGTGIVFAPTRSAETAMQAEQVLPPTHHMPMREQRPRGWTQTTNTIKVFDSFQGVLEAFGEDVGIKVIIRSGRVFSRKALGQFNLGTFIIRVRHAHDIPTSAHEIGHAIHSLILEDTLAGISKRPDKNKPRGFIEDPLPEGVDKELVALGKNLYPGLKRPPKGGYRSEGIAEYFTVLFLDPANAPQVAPKFNEWFHKKFLPRHPKGMKAIIKAQDTVNVFQEQGSTERAIQHIVDTDSLADRTRDMKKLLAKAIGFESIFEGLAPMWTMVRAIEDLTGKPLASRDNPFELAKSARGTHDTILDRWVTKNMTAPNGWAVGPSLDQAVSLVRGKERRFAAYLLAKRTIALWQDPLRIKKGLPPRATGLSFRDAQVTIEELEAAEDRNRPRIEKRRERLREKLRQKKVSQLIKIADKRFIDTSSISALDSDIVIRPRLPAGTRDKIDSLIDDIVNRDHPFHRFHLAAQLVYDWNNGVLNYIAGFSPVFAEHVRRIRKTDPGSYIPLERIFNELEMEAFNVSRGTSGGTSGLGGTAFVKRLLGSFRPIKNPFQVMRDNARVMIRSAHDRFILEKIIALAKAYPEAGSRFVEEVPRGKELAYVTNMQRLVDEMKKAVKDADPGLAEIFEDIDLGKFATRPIEFYTPARIERAKAGEKIIATIIDESDQVRVFQIDAELYRALDRLESLHPEMTSAWNILVMDKFLRPTKRILTLGTTGMSPGFSLAANVAADIQSLLLYTQASANPIIGIYQWARAMTNGFLSQGGFVEESPMLKLWQNSGGPISTQLGYDTAAARHARKRNFQGRVIRVIDPRNYVDLYRHVLQIPENSPRVAEMALVAKDMGIDENDLRSISIEEMMILRLAGKEPTTDFSATGGDNLVRNLTSIIPFMNAGLQGPRAGVRAEQRTPGTFYIRGLGFTALTLAIWWKNKDEDWWKDTNKEERLLYTMFDFGNEVIKIKRPFEGGYLFMSLPEALMDAWYTKDPGKVTDFMMSTMKTMNPVFSGPTVGNPFLETSLEQYANRDTYWDRPIVPIGMEGRRPGQQVSVYSSRLAIFFGDMFPNHISPIRVDHAIRGIGGSVTVEVMNLLGLGTPSDIREAELSDIPIAGRFFRRGGIAGTRPRSVDDLYDERETLRQEQLDTKEPETIEERTRRFLIDDAILNVSDLMAIRRVTPQNDLRRRMTIEMSNIAQNALSGKRIDLNEHTEIYIHKQIRRFSGSKVKRGSGEDLEDFKLRKKKVEALRKSARNVLLSVEATPDELIEVHRRLTKLKGGFKAVLVVNSSGRLTAFGKEIREIRKLKPE